MKHSKVIVIFTSCVLVCIFLATRLARANEHDYPEGYKLDFSQQQVDQLLAPIALYPDTLLSHILIASTHPIDLHLAQRWLSQRPDLRGQAALDASQGFDWHPSVKALVPFPEIVENMQSDLEWLKNLATLFQQDEQWILSRVQVLRKQAQDAGNLQDNDYIQVVEDTRQIVIQPVEKEIIYVPYYDPRKIYGTWHWREYQPYAWRRPANYYWYAGHYWSPRVHVRSRYYNVGYVHWRNRHVQVNYYHYPRYKHHSYYRKHHGNRYIHWRNSYPKYKRKSDSRERQNNSYHSKRSILRHHTAKLNKRRYHSHKIVNKPVNQAKHGQRPNQHKIQRQGEHHQYAQTHKKSYTSGRTVSLQRRKPSSYSGQHKHKKQQTLRRLTSSGAKPYQRKTPASAQRHKVVKRTSQHKAAAYSKQHNNARTSSVQRSKTKSYHNQRTVKRKMHQPNRSNKLVRASHSRHKL